MAGGAVFDILSTMGLAQAADKVLHCDLPWLHWVWLIEVFHSEKVMPSFTPLYDGEPKNLDRVPSNSQWIAWRWIH